MTVNQALAPGASWLSDSCCPTGMAPQAPHCCETALSPPSGSTGSTRRSVTSAADTLVTWIPNWSPRPVCVAHAPPTTWVSASAPEAADAAEEAAAWGGWALPAACRSPAAYPTASPASRPTSRVSRTTSRLSPPMNSG